MKFDDIIQKQKKFFESGTTKSLKFRKNILEKLLSEIMNNEEEIQNSLKNDLSKNEVESYITEIFPLKEEIKNMIKNINKYSKKIYKKTTIFNFPSRAYTVAEPYGIAVIISPWNYPFYLSMMPLVGSIAAGNCTILKLSEKTENTNKIIRKILNNISDNEHIYISECDKNDTIDLLKQKIDYVFFTGGNIVATEIVKVLSDRLIPYTMELGGKSPVIVDEFANLDVAARRVIFGKFLNAGQTCVSPDYLLVNEKIYNNFKEKLMSSLRKMYLETDNFKRSSRIIDKNSADRLMSYIEKNEIITGGNIDYETLIMEPTIVKVSEANLTQPIMKNEIFGPILPIMVYNNIEDAVKIINSIEKPLIIYIFSKLKSNIDYIMNSTSSGTVCINDCITQIIETDLPFGGVGRSGNGRYHGKASYTNFSNIKSVMVKTNMFDFNFRYPPYDNKLIKFIKIIKK